MRLIDANAVVKAILEERDKIPRTITTAPYELGTEKPFHAGDQMRGGIRKALRCIEQAPTVDAVVVTRCKDCKYLRVWNQKDLYAFCPKTNFVFLPFQADTRTHFCSLGEPKEGTHADDYD